MGDWTTRAVSADQAVSSIADGARVFVHGAAATPTPLLEALSRRQDLAGVTLYHLHTAGPAPFADPSHAGRFLSVSLFTGAPLREAVAEGRAEFVPVFLSDIPRLFTSKTIALDVALVQLRFPTATGTARWARRSMPPWPPRTRRATSSPRSTSACRARTATR